MHALVVGANGGTWLGRAVHRGTTLLQDVRELVGQEVLTGSRAGLIGAGPEVDVGAVGEGTGSQARTEIGRLGVAVDAHFAEIGPEASLHAVPDRSRQGVTAATPGGQALGD